MNAELERTQAVGQHHLRLVPCPDIAWARHDHDLAVVLAPGLGLLPTGAGFARHPTAVLDRHPGAQLTEVIMACPGSMPPSPGRAYSRTFPAHAEQVAQARRFTARVLAGSPAASDAMLICSELASNAVQHSASAGPGGQFTVRAGIGDGDCAWIEVEDQGGRWAAGKRSDERGRGLVIVDELAASWDIRGDDAGRVVYAQLAWPVLS